ncbi:MAG: aminotransferase class V-fold PLP-dependent enzyme [Planctomycetota bacterium]
MNLTKQLYLDNAATSFPKPEEVYRAVDRYNREVGASAGRGAYAEAIEAGKILDGCRHRLRRLLRVDDAARILFTLNATDALNLAIKGVLERGDHVVTSWMDHNSVLRPLRELELRGEITVTRVRASVEGMVAADAVARAMTAKTRLVAMVHGSNVVGSLLPVAAIAERARAVGALFLLDGAQTVGARPVYPDELGVDLLAFPGHKALLGPLGTGALYVRKGVELRTLREGGTGSRSEEDVQPPEFPDRHEAGSHNLPGIAGLLAALDYLLERGLEEIQAHKLELTRAFLAGCRQIGNLKVHGPTRAVDREPVFSVSLEGLDPHELAALLETECGVRSRAGLHCAPLAHQTLGTFPEGTTRLSFGALNTVEDVSAAVEGLARIAGVTGVREHRSTLSSPKGTS